uniref:Uncharacterized protein n=1 Tax=Anopheles minimus TaxID=112268 RepID=A0A182W1T0_9DIPT
MPRSAPYWNAVWGLISVTGVTLQHHGLGKIVRLNPGTRECIACTAILVQKSTRPWCSRVRKCEHHISLVKVNTY